MNKNLFLAWLSGAFVLALLIFMLSVNLAQNSESKLPQDSPLNKDVIELISAEHLDINKQQISEIYSSVRRQDGKWSSIVSSGEYVKLKFESKLSFGNDITVYPKIISGSPTIKVYDQVDSRLVAGFSNLKENEYNKALIMGTRGDDTFFLFIENGSVQFDQILDPNVTTLVPTNRTQNTTWGRLTENTHTFSTQTHLSVNCYTNISSQNDVNCTQTGTAALDAYIMMNISLPEAISRNYIVNITLYARGANIAGLDRLNITLFNWTAGTWKSYNGTDAIPAGNSSKNLTVYIGQDRLPVSDFVNAANQVRFMFRTQGSSNDHLKADYMEAVVRYNSSFSRNITDLINFTMSENGQGNTGKFIRSPSDAGNIFDSADFFEFTPTQQTNSSVNISSLFGFFAGRGGTYGGSRQNSDATSLSSGQFRQTKLFRGIRDLFNLSNIANRVTSLFRTSADKIIFNDTNSRRTSLSRGSSQKLSLNELTTRLATILRAPAQVLNINTLGERVAGIMQYFVNIVQNIITNLTQGRAGSFKRSNSDAVSFTSMTNRISSLFKFPTQLFNVNSKSDRTYRANRATSQGISFSSITTRLANLFNRPTQTINANAGLSKYYSTSRATSQQFSLNNVANRIAGFFKLPTQLFNVNDATTKSYKTSRATSQRVSFTSMTNRIAGFFKLPTQLFNVNDATTKSYKTSRATSQQFSLNSISVRLANLVRSPSGILNFASSILERLGLVRSPSDKATINANAIRTTALARSNSQIISLSEIGSRIKGIFKTNKDSLNFASTPNGIRGFGRPVVQSISFKEVNNRLLKIIRVPTQILNLETIGIKASLFVQYIVSVAQSLGIDDILSRLTNLFNRPTQTINANAGLSKYYSTSRGTSQQFSLNNVANRISSLFKFPTQLFNVNSKSDRIYGANRATSQRVSFTSMTNRISSLFKFPTQLFNVSSTSVRQTSLGRSSNQELSLNNMAVRIKGMVRAPAQIIYLPQKVFKNIGLLLSTSQNFGINELSNRLAVILRYPTQSLNLDNISYRIASLFKRPLDTLNLNSESYRIKGVTRSTSQELSLSLVTFRLKNVIRAPVDILTLNTLSKRVGELLQYLIDISDRVGITSSANRIAGLFRGMSDWLQYMLSILTGQGTATSQSTSSSSSSGGSGGSSSGGSSASSSSGLVISPNKLSLSIKQGEVKKKEVVIKNTGSSIRHITLSAPELNKFVKFDKTSLDISPGESITIPITFLVEEDTKADIYLGKIILESSGVKDEILVALAVSSKNPLFDVKATIPDRFSNLHSGDEFLMEVNVFNLGEIGTVDVKVTYTLMNEKKETVFSQEETIAVQTQSSLVKSFKLPSDIKPGNYILYVKTVYGTGDSQSIASASAWLTVRSNQTIPTWVLLTAIAGLLLLAVVLLMYLKHKRINKHKHESKRHTIRHRMINRGLILRRRIAERIHRHIVHRIHSLKSKKSLNTTYAHHGRVKR